MDEAMNWLVSNNEVKPGDIDVDVPSMTISGVSMRR
jgi:hypothetical protein